MVADDYGREVQQRVFDLETMNAQNAIRIAAEIPKCVSKCVDGIGA